MQGFSISSPWSPEASCRCGGCAGRNGRLKARPAATQIGNAIVPAQAYAWGKHFGRALSSHLATRNLDSACPAASETGPTAMPTGSTDPIDAVLSLVTDLALELAQAVTQDAVAAPRTAEEPAMAFDELRNC